MPDLLGVGGISGGAASQEISRGIFSGWHFDGEELMLGSHLLPHARWPLNVRIAAVFNDMGEVRRSASTEDACVAISFGCLARTGRAIRRKCRVRVAGGC